MYLLDALYVSYLSNTSKPGGESSCNGPLWQLDKWGGGSWLSPGYKTPLTPWLFTHQKSIYLQVKCDNMKYDFSIANTHDQKIQTKSFLLWTQDKNHKNHERF